jgi:hypothetical protein
LFTSIVAHGGWSKGKVLDVYFQFAAGGDHCKSIAACDGWSKGRTLDIYFQFAAGGDHYI